MTKLSQKRNISSMQVIKTLQALFQGDYSMSELIDKLNAQEPDSVFNNSVISKYINTCRYFGIEIPKINNRYYVSNVPFGLKIAIEDIDLFNEIQFVVNRDMSSKTKTLFNSFMAKINRFSNKKIARVDKKNFEISFELFEKAVAKKRKVKLIFKNQEYLECIPLKIIEENNKKYFVVYNKRERMIDLNRLSGVEVLDEKFVNKFGGEQTVVFKLTGALAKRYEARENETVSLNSDGSVNVTNTSEPKEVLFARLLRYDTSCEILSPKTFRTEFRQIIESVLQNYGE